MGVGAGHGIKYIELEGNVVVLANGAGLTTIVMEDRFTGLKSAVAPTISACVWLC